MNLVATASGTSVTLVWTAPGSGDPVTTYVIEAGSATGLANLANSPTNSTATVFSAGGVGNGTYFVRAVAVNAFGQSPASNEVVVTVGIPTTFAGQWVSVAPDGIVFPGSGFCSAIIASGTFSTNRLTTTGTYIPSRTWVDANRNLLPDCDLFSPAQNGECGAALTSGQSLTLTATR